MVIVAFLIPLAVYLLMLSWVNRQPGPIFVSGTWDFVALLFAASGFLLIGGPVALSSLNERWRILWLLADTSSLPEGLDVYRELWVFLALLYFLLVVGGSAWGLYHRRGITCIYNAEPAAVESALNESFHQLGLSPVRSGDLYLFGLSPFSFVKTQTEPEGTPPTPGATLEFESFTLLRHVSLRWEPHDSPLRAAVEEELRRRLSDVVTPEHEASVWFSRAGTLMLLLSTLITLALVLRAILSR